jgi:hypothetical protein
MRWREAISAAKPEVHMRNRDCCAAGGRLLHHSTIHSRHHPTHSVPLFAPREEASSPRTAPDLRSVAVWIPPAGSGANDRAGRRTPSMSWPARIRSTVSFCADPPMGRLGRIRRHPAYFPSAAARRHGSFLVFWPCCTHFFS